MIMASHQCERHMNRKRGHAKGSRKENNNENNAYKGQVIDRSTHFIHTKQQQENQEQQYINHDHC